MFSGLFLMPENLPKSMPKPSKIQVWSVIFGIILDLWAAPNINLYFLLLFSGFGRVLEPSWPPSWLQVGTQKAPQKPSKTNAKNDLNSSAP